MASASSGIGDINFTAAPATNGRAVGGDTQTLLIIAAAALVVLLFLRK